MIKLSTMEKLERKAYKGMMTAKNGEMFTDDNFKITVVVVPACGHENSEFVQVAVAQCSSGDTFKRKRGEAVALERWANGCSLSVRRNGRTLEDVADDMVGFLTM
jgi:hypothetical protein